MYLCLNDKRVRHSKNVVGNPLDRYNRKQPYACQTAAERHRVIQHYAEAEGEPYSFFFGC